MPRLSHAPRRFAALIFDLDETLLARAAAWCYALEEGVLSVTGQRLDARPLADEYRARPWRHALEIVLEDRDALGRCEDLCAEFFGRSALKRLLVHEGIGMALDHVRSERVEIGAVSREPHTLALRQVQSTGLDRFLTVLAATPEGSRWDPGERIAQCLAFLGREPGRAGYVSADSYDLREARRRGLSPIGAGWAGAAPGDYVLLDQPADLARLAAEEQA